MGNRAARRPFQSIIEGVTCFNWIVNVMKKNPTWQQMLFVPDCFCGIGFPDFPGFM